MRLLPFIALLLPVLAQEPAPRTGSVDPIYSLTGRPAAATNAAAPAPQTPPPAPAPAPAPAPQADGKTPAAPATPGAPTAPGQDPAPAPPPAPAPEAPAPLPDDGIRVAVLGYHDFSQTAKETDMIIRTAKFRRQMFALRDLGLTVISMADFQAWKRGEKTIPEKSVVITIDDGWKAVYTDAFPVLKELNYPFTLFLYKSYLDGGGRALTTPMVEEMMKHGANIGSHSVTHSYPQAYRRKGADVYQKFLHTEFTDSKTFLEAKLGVSVTTYAYPGGITTPEMFPIAKEAGYTQLFTVLPGKVRRSSEDLTLPRYIILGTHDRIFDLATTFNESTVGMIPGQPGELPQQNTPYPVKPEPGSVVDTRLPLITADLSTVTDLDPKTLVMKVGGFGDVPATFDAETKLLRWQVNRRLRSPTCQVSVTWKNALGKPPEVPLRWSFRVDAEAAYAPRDN